jgi:hypothetical protein
VEKPPPMLRAVARALATATPFPMAVAVACKGISEGGSLSCADQQEKQ